MKFILIVLINAEVMVIQTGTFMPAPAIALQQFEDEAACRSALRTVQGMMAIFREGQWRGECVPAASK